MSSHLHLLRERARQATADRVRAELSLAAVMVTIEPEFSAPIAEAIRWRKWESRVEHPSATNGALSLAWSAFMRARRLEDRARLVAHRARWSEPTLAPSFSTGALTPAEVYRGLCELRAAA